VKQDPLAPRSEESDSDEALMDRYCAGDVAAFDLLFRRYTGRLVRFLSPMVGRTHAHDVAQVTFMKLHENRHRYRAGASFAAWAFTIARNTALDHIRSAPQRREVGGVDVEPSSDAPLRDAFANARVRAALEQLPDGERQVVLLHWFGGLTFEEVAVVVGAKNAAVRVRAHRAYEKLRTVLDGLNREVSR